MRRVEIEPDGITCLGVSVACNHAALVGFACQYYASVNQVVPELKHYMDA
jgi:hypothetical protein